MCKLEIGSLVRVKDNYYVTDLVGKIGKVVAYSTGFENITVQFEGMEGHPDLHDGNGFIDRKLDGKRDKRHISQTNLEWEEEQPYSIEELLKGE